MLDHSRQVIGHEPWRGDCRRHDWMLTRSVSDDIHYTFQTRLATGADQLTEPLLA